MERLYSSNYCNAMQQLLIIAITTPVLVKHKFVYKYSDWTYWQHSVGKKQSSNPLEKKSLMWNMPTAAVVAF